MNGRFQSAADHQGPTPTDPATQGRATLRWNTAKRPPAVIRARNIMKNDFFDISHR